MNQYFMYLQQNVVHGADLSAVASEAERRHRQVLQQVVEIYEQQCRRALDNTIAEARHAIGMQAEEANREITRLRDENVQLVGNLTVANAGIQSREMRIDQLNAELLRSDQKCRSLVDEAVATMSSQMDAREHDLRQHYEAQLENSRIMSEGLQAEIDRLSAEAAQAIAHDSSWQPVGGSMPNAQVDQAQQHESLDDYMRNRVRSALDSGIGPLEGEKTRHHASAAVAGPPKPTLPITGEMKEPQEGSFVGSPSLISAQDRGDATQELLKSLTKLLADKSSESKPKVKEADTIKLADQPTPESYRHWKNAVREEIRAASDKPDKAWEWLAEVYDKNLKPAEKMEKLQDPGDFGTLDIKLFAALTRSAKGDLSQKILNHKEEQSMKGILVRGRQVLYMFDEYFRTSEEAGNLYQLEDLLKVARKGDNIEDLKRFMNYWDRVLAGMNPIPEEASLRDIFMRQVRECPLIRLDIELYERATKTDTMRQGDGQAETIIKSYAYLYNCCKNLLDRERLRVNRERIAEKGNPKGGRKGDPSTAYAAAIAAALAKGKGKGKGKSKSQSRERGPCYEFMKTGKCSKGKNCNFSHEKPMKTPGKGKGKSKSPKRTGSPKRMSKEEMAKTPCVHFARGHCNRGEKCLFMHGEKVAAVQENTRPNSPKPKPKAKAATVILKEDDEIERTCAICTQVTDIRSCLKNPSSGKTKKKTRISNRVGFIDVKPYGRQVSVGQDRRQYEKVYKMAEECPPSEKDHVDAAIESARRLANILSNMQKQESPENRLEGTWQLVMPKCRLECKWLECQKCKHLSHADEEDETAIPAGTVEKVSEIDTCIPLPLPKPRERKSWLIDSGSEIDVVSKSDLPSVNATNARSSPKPVNLTTANGRTKAANFADVKIGVLEDTFSPYILEESPLVLSLGKRCLDEGYGFAWPPGGEPVLLRPDNTVIKLKLEGHVPVIDESCKQVSRETADYEGLLAMATRLVHEADLLPVMASHKKAPQEREQEEEDGIEEHGDEETRAAVKSRTVDELMAEATSLEHQFRHYPKNPFCRICTRALMMKPPARAKGGQGRVPTKKFGDHVIADHVLIKRNVEEGWKGEVVALVVKDLHTQFRCVYPATSKSSDECCKAFQHFIGPQDEVEVIYTDNAPELKSAVEYLGYRHQTSIEYMDSTMSFVEREVRQMLEGCRTNLVQSGLPERYWPLAMQHFAFAHNVQLSLGNEQTPWERRFEEAFVGPLVPFGCKVLFWNNTSRLDDSSGKTSPRACEGLFLGYHMQPGHKWKGEFLVCKLEAADYHLDNASITVQRVRKVELEGGVIFPIRAAKDAAQPKAITGDELIVPREQEHSMEFSVEYEPSIDADAVGDEQPGGPASGSKGPDDDLEKTPDGRPIPKGHHWDGIRIVKTYKGSKRPKDISSEFWRSIGPKDRQKLIEEDAKKRSAAVKTEQAEPKKKKKKKNAQETTLCQLPLVGKWKEIQESAEKTEPVPVMPCVRPAPDEPHRESLREVIKDKIRELEFKNALELYAAVARLVSKDEVSRTPKAQEAMDKEWNKLLSRGVWDQSRVCECQEIIAEARSRGETVHLGRIFEACYEKGSELSHDDPRRKFKGRTVFQGNNVHDENWDHALFAEMGSSPASMEAAKVLDAYGSQPGFSKQQADAVQAYVQALFKGTPTWVSLPRNRWPKVLEPAGAPHLGTLRPPRLRGAVGTAS